LRRVKFLGTVRADLLVIRSYIADQSGSRSVAQQFMVLLREQCHRLASLPGELGRPRPDVGPAIRSVPFRGYLIFFRYSGENFEVLKIVEGHRDDASPD
jgi:plasmid stabilization system protein ParE